ncbi:MAG: succinylglutamate desuccinylase/aspartoacylase family protein [Candidatus Colwellbacteria bacterium]|nr:succinylglutamate desuccinylase/aspartoacylase family protein [Candidatus Colwellbacteria bacterium]
MPEDMIQIRGELEGPTSIILAGVHGDEKCGTEALLKLIPNLQIKKGIVWFGYGNPRAIEKNVRYTETNLNRMFKSDDELDDTEKSSYEYERARFLKKYLDKADALLDLHASFTPGAKPFVLCEANANDIVKYLPFDLMVTGFDEVEPGGTDYYMNKMGKIGICAECGYLGDPESTKRAEESIIFFLKARGHIDGEVVAKGLSYIHMYQLYLTKTNKFVLAKPFKDFEEIRSGQVVGTDGSEEIRAPKDSIILFARDRNQINDEGFLLGEKKSSLA